MDARGEVLSQLVIRSDVYGADADAYIKALAEAIKKVVKDSDKEGQIRGVGVGAPNGNYYTNSISFAPNLAWAANGTVEFGKLLSEALGGIPVAITNDANAAASGEMTYGVARGMKNFIMITLGTGVGSGFVVDGVLDEHSDRVPEGGEVWNLPFGDTIVDASFSTRWVVGRYEQLTGKKVPGAKEVAQACKEGEKEAQQLFHEYGERMAAFASPVLTRFGADTLVLGGNISRNYALFCGPLLAGLPEGVEVRTSQLLDQAAMIGAASLFKDE